MDVNREIDILFLSRIAKHRARMNTDNLIIIAAMRISILFRNISKSRAPFFQSFKKKKKRIYDRSSTNVSITCSEDKLI